jgi:glutathione S-transferase
MATTLLWNKDWPNAQAVRVVFLELGLKEGVDYELQTVDIAGGGTSTAAFLKQSPQGLLPVAKIPMANNAPELVVWEPVGIVSYSVVQAMLSQQQPSPVLGPVNPCQFPLTYQWSVWTRHHLTVPTERLLLHGNILPQGQRKPEKMQPALAKFRKAVELLEKVVPSPGSFMNVDATQASAFSVADALVCSALTMGRGIPSSRFDFAHFPRVDAYLKSVEQRQSFVKAFGANRPPLVFPA